MDTIVSATAPVAVAVKAWWPVIWLAGLVAVIFLWQRVHRLLQGNQTTVIDKEDSQ